MLAHYVMWEQSNESAFLFVAFTFDEEVLIHLLRMSVHLLTTSKDF